LTESSQIFYEYFLINKTQIIELINDLLNKYESVKNDVNITTEYNNLITFIQKNYNDILNDVKSSPILILTFFITLQGYFKQIMHIFHYLLLNLYF
jgi:hypothetical protein